MREVWFKDDELMVLGKMKEENKIVGDTWQWFTCISFIFECIDFFFVRPERGSCQQNISNKTKDIGLSTHLFLFVLFLHPLHILFINLHTVYTTNHTVSIN